MRVSGLAVILAIICWGNSALSDTIDINGVARTYILQRADTRPAPLVIVLHGNTQTGAAMVARTSWPAVAKREHFGVVFPDGLNRAWADLRPGTKRAGRAPPEGTDDVGFIVQLIEKLIADGTADPLIPYEGGRGTSRFAVPGFWSTMKTFDFWRRVNGCEAPDVASTDLDHRDASDKTVTRIESRCPPGRDVVLYRINDGGHRMPGNFPDARFPRLVSALLGPQNRDIDGAEIIWGFFRKFP
jgi:polyhydroxybutyrate depolymerase